MSEDEVLPCWIYRSDKKLESYLYLAQEDGTDAVPDGLLSAMLPLELVMQLDLHAERELARADVVQVMRELRERGFYLQMPPTEFEKIDPRSGSVH
jgi:uncharacterized protein